MTTRSEELLSEAQRLTDEAGALWNDGAYPSAEATCRQALNLTRLAVGDNDPRLAERLYNLATLYSFQRLPGEASHLFWEAIGIYENQPQLDLPAMAYCYAWLGKTLFAAWRDDPEIDDDDEERYLDEAETCYQKAMDLLARAHAEETLEYADCLLQLGFLYYYRNKPEPAEPLYCSALLLREKILGPHHLETAEAVGRLAILYWQDESGRVDPEPHLRRALDIREKHLEESNPDLWEWIYRLAEHCRAHGRDGEADRLFLRLADHIASAEPPDEDVNWIVSGCLDYLRGSGRSKRARAIEARGYLENPNIRLKRVELKRHEAMFGPDSPRTAHMLKILADDLRFEQQYDEAEALYSRALRIIESAFGLDAPLLVPILNGIALIQRAQDRIDLARSVLERAVAIPPGVRDGQQIAEHAGALEQLAWVRAAESEENEAEALYLHAVALVEETAPRNDRLAAEMRFRLSIFYTNDGRFARAEEHILAAISTAQITHALDNLEVADYREQYAEVLIGLGRHDEAAIQLAKVRKIWECAGSMP